MNISEELIAKITKEIINRYYSDNSSQDHKNNSNLIPIAISNRHVHLSENDFYKLFGSNKKLSKKKDLSQPGQFAANETVTLFGPKGIIENVRILGPFRSQTQIEISKTDAFKLGINPPIRDSGDLENSSSIIIVGPTGAVNLKEGVIIALRHIHMTPEDANFFGVKDKQKVRVRTFGERSIIFGEVLCRVSDKFKLEMHVDTDEGNAAFVKTGDLVEIIK